MSYRVHVRSGPPYDFDEDTLLTLEGEYYVFREDDVRVIEVLPVDDVVAVVDLDAALKDE